MLILFKYHISFNNVLDFILSLDNILTTEYFT